MLSAIFTHARGSGTLHGPNPTDGVEIPDGKRTDKTHKYTLEQVEKITDAVDGTARCAVVLAAWTGLSLAELRGLKWKDIDFEKEQLNVIRTVWHKEIIDTKTQHRKDAVHLLPNVISELKQHQERNPGTTWVFEGPRAFPLDLATLGSKRIKHALKPTGVEWRGFHAFRRGLGTRLYNNGTPIDTVAKGWIGTWATAAQPFLAKSLQTYRNQTLRLIVHASVGGTRVRIKITCTRSEMCYVELALVLRTTVIAIKTWSVFPTLRQVVAKFPIVRLCELPLRYPIRKMLCRASRGRCP